jgi:putative FmdB family regulatory protein
MPIHEYQCNDCGYIFEEVTVKMSATKISTHCPVCKQKGKDAIARKLISGGTVFTVHGYNSNNGYSGHMR